MIENVKASSLSFLGKIVKLKHLTRKSRRQLREDTQIRLKGRWGSREQGKRNGDGVFLSLINYAFQKVQVLCFLEQIQMIFNLIKQKIWSFYPIMQYLENIRQGNNISGCSSVILHSLLLTFQKIGPIILTDKIPKHQ